MTSRGNEISIINSPAPDEIETLKAVFDSAWSATEFQDKYVELIQRGEKPPADKMASLLAHNVSSIIITDVEYLHCKEHTQRGLAWVLRRVAAEHNKIVCVTGRDLKELTPMLLEEIAAYNESAKTKEKPKSEHGKSIRVEPVFASSTLERVSKFRKRGDFPSKTHERGMHVKTGLEEEAARLKKNFALGVHSVKADKSRRITLPKALFGDISTTDELVIVGVGDHCEIWRKDAWERALDERAASDDA